MIDQGYWNDRRVMSILNHLLNGYIRPGVDVRAQHAQQSRQIDLDLTSFQRGFFRIGKGDGFSFDIPLW